MSIKLLLSLADANKSLEKVISFIEIKLLFSKMLEIYTERIRPNVKTILNGVAIGFESPYHKKITETGFDIFIFLSILKEVSPKHSKLQLFQIDPTIYFDPFSSKTPKKIRKNVIVPLNPNNFHAKLTESYQNIQNIDKNMLENNNIDRENSKTSISNENSNENSDLSNEKGDNSFTEELQRCMRFYNSLVGDVEIVYEGVLRRIYFPKPFLSIYMTDNIKRNLLIEGRNNLLKTRLEHLLRNIECYKNEMMHFRMIGRIKFLNYLVKSWRTTKDISLVLIVFILLLLLSGDVGSLTIINQIVTIIQLILGVFVAVFCIVERYPMSMGLNYPFQDSLTRYLKKKNYYSKSSFHKTSFRHQICIKINKIYDKFEKSKLKVLKIFLDYDNLYNLVYLTFTVLAFNNPYFYCLMLLDLIKRSRILQNIIRAVTDNWKQLFKLLILGLVIVYIFAAWAYTEFDEKFVEIKGDFSLSSYADYLYLAFTSTLNNGVRNQGGMGSVLLGYTLGFIIVLFLKKYFLYFFLFFRRGKLLEFLVV